MKTIKVYDRQDFPPYLPKLNALYDDLFADGKGLRSHLIQKISHYVNLDKKRIHLLSQTIEFVHNASLLHDDLVDRSHLRRNKTSAWLKYSPEYAVLAGDYLLARVMVNLSRNGNLRLIQLTAEIISDLLEGEWMQDALVKDWGVKLEQLDRVHVLKTASLFKWCLQAPFIAKEVYDENLLEILRESGSVLGVLFQRSDDLLDFDVRNFEGKAILGDLKSGYLNSFAAYLTEELDSQRKQEFIGSKTMAAVKKALGETYFRAKLDSFDDMNRNLLEEYHHLVEQLRPMLSDRQHGLIQDLLDLGNFLYWRKK